jgi:membrane protease YdiL (CAAX protease family)
MDKISLSDKHPIVSSIIATSLFLLVIFIGGAISAITGVSSKATLFIAFSIVAIILAIYANKKNYWHCYGFNSINKMDDKNKRLFIPLFIIALLPLIVGFSDNLKLEDILYIIGFMALVAFAEETMFRGVILRTLQKKSNMHAIWGSCLLFSIPHIINTLNGKDLFQTIIQILFAFVIGLISAMLIIKTNNIIPLIIYHFINNIVSSVTSSNVDTSFALYLTSTIFVIGLIYMIYLHQLIKHNSSKAEKDVLSHINIQ